MEAIQTARLRAGFALWKKRQEIESENPSPDRERARRAMMSDQERADLLLQEFKSWSLHRALIGATLQRIATLRDSRSPVKSSPTPRDFWIGAQIGEKMADFNDKPEGKQAFIIAELKLLARFEDERERIQDFLCDVAEGAVPSSRAIRFLAVQAHNAITKEFYDVQASPSQGSA